MKTEQEQIDEMVKVIKGFDICGLFERCFSTGADGENTRYITCPECFAEALYNAGYGDVSEYKAEIERLKEENGQSRKLGILGNNATVEFLDDAVSEPSVDCKDIEKYAKQFRNRIISINEKEIKQAKLDVLKELKTRHDYAIKYMGYPWDISQQIDELIKEVQNGEDKG